MDSFAILGRRTAEWTYDTYLYCICGRTRSIMRRSNNNNKYHDNNYYP